jgi:beta-glucosidase-like glycosyl hydrolase
MTYLTGRETLQLFRDPRWGRGQEVPGEDPHLTSRYAVNFVRGLQEDAADPKHLKIIATCKHFFAYDVDAGDGSFGDHSEPNYDRHYFDAVVTKADLADYYLPAWEACATEAKAASIMCRSACAAILARNPLANPFEPAPLSELALDTNAMASMPLLRRSYNALNGTPSCANSAYQNALLRDSWGWGAASVGEKMSDSVLSPYIVRHHLQRLSG